MTQDVQPLTWQKRTNLEEHQQFFSKINEIIANLAPTVDEAEQAIAQANQAIASANAAISTANAASANADAASQQAQTAANTVAGYDARLTTAEGDIDALQSADQTINGSIASLGNRMTAVESKNTQQDASIGALETADGQNVKISRINEYAVGLTGNQANIIGIKGFASIMASTASGRIAGPSECVDLIKLPLYANTPYNVSGIFASRHDIGIAKVAITTDTNSVVSSVSVDAVNSASSRTYKIGARAENNKLIVSMTGTLNNMNVTALILTSSYSTGVILTPDYVGLPVVQTIANLDGYVQEV